jgi:flagellar hook-associated protein 3 FlgL
MTIRVTLGMLNSQFIRNLNTNLTRTETLQNQGSSGKLISKPSDDPVGITFAMRYRSEIAANQQHQRNLGAAVSFLENIDVTLNQATSLMQRIRELNVQAANDTNDKSSREMIAMEIDQLTREFVNIANTKYNDKYIFNGEKTDVKPYDELIEKPNEAVTDPGSIKFEVGVGVTVPTSITGNDVFGYPDEDDNLFTILENLTASIRSGNTAEMNNALAFIDTRMDKVLGSRAIVGARMNRIEFISTRLEDIDLNLTRLQSEVEDVNYAELLVQMKAHESVYQASLSTGAKIITPTLIDFLR